MTRGEEKPCSSKLRNRRDSMLLTRLLEVLQSSPQGRRILGISMIALVVLYWLTRRSARSAHRPHQGRLGGDEHAGVPRPTIAVKAGFHHIPAQRKVVLMANDSIFDSHELAAIESAANSAAASSTPRILRLLPSSVASVLELARVCDLYIITQCSSDAAEEAVRAALLESGLVDAGLCHHKILFCETEKGRGAMARQLEPSLHIDSSARTLQSLAPFVPLLLGVRTPENAEVLDHLLVPNLTTVDDISDYFVKPSSRAQGEA